MAEEADAEAQTETEGVSKRLVVILVLLSVMVMVVTPVLTITAVKMLTESSTPADTELIETFSIALPRVQINIADTMGKRYAQLDIVVDVNDKRMLELFQEQSKDRPKGKQKRVLATIIQIVGDKNLSALLSSDAKIKLAKEIQTALNDVLRNDSLGMVTDVYFYGFLIQ